MSKTTAFFLPQCIYATSTKVCNFSPMKRYGAKDKNKDNVEACKGSFKSIYLLVVQ
jgi:hypothetical protein